MTALVCSLMYCSCSFLIWGLLLLSDFQEFCTNTVLSLQKILNLMEFAVEKRVRAHIYTHTHAQTHTHTHQDAFPLQNSGSDIVQSEFAESLRYSLTSIATKTAPNLARTFENCVFVCLGNGEHSNLTNSPRHVSMQHPHTDTQSHKP